MIYKKFNAKSLCILFIFLLSFFAFFSDIKTVSASETGQVFNADIIVESDSETGQSMIEANFNKSVKIEKFGDLNYVFLKTVDEGVIQNLSLKYNNYNVGCLTIDSATTLFTISDTNLSKEYIASAYIDVMGSNVTFKLSIDISSMTSINESLLEIEERPAEYVPVLSYSDSTDFDTRNQGSSVTLPTAEGKIATIICDISIEVYYQAGTKKVAVNVVDNQFTITNAGNYYIYYIASSDSYQTSLGNNTTSIEEFKLFSLSNGGVAYSVYENEEGIVSIGDINSSLSGFVTLDSYSISSGEIFDLISLELKNVSTEFLVYSINIIDSEQNTVNFDDKMQISIKIDGTYDRSKTNLYYYHDGKLEKVNSSVYLNKIVATTNLNGVFIVAEGNVEKANLTIIFIVIFSCIFLLAICGIVTLLILKRKGKFLIEKTSEGA